MGGLFCWLGLFMSGMTALKPSQVQISQHQLGVRSGVSTEQLSIAFQTMSFRSVPTAKLHHSVRAHSLPWVVLWSRGLLASSPIFLHSGALATHSSQLLLPPLAAIWLPQEKQECGAKWLHCWFCFLWGSTSALPALFTWKILFKNTGAFYKP